MPKNVLTEFVLAPEVMFCVIVARVGSGAEQCQSSGQETVEMRAVNTGHARSTTT